ncbi:methyltransferase domain-containing protein [Amycolatopsis sp. NPDC051061]|uniref:SAM-dependent methyltransferase n=1 Tax=Amycolatopsis sp. NPDC051061 TaxID=3155042 RepID=UPI0034285BC7
MSKTSIPLPVPENVGKLYDQILKDEHEYDQFEKFNHQLHIGYWDDPSDQSVPMGEAVVRLTDLMIERLKVGAGDHVLDLGCGIGGPASQIVMNTGANVTGVSISEEQIKLAARLAANKGVAERAKFQRADAMQLPFEDESFDAVMALESILHMPSREQVLSEARRVLKPGGRLVLTDFFTRAPHNHDAELHPAIEGFCRVAMITMADVDDYAAMLHRVGLRVRELRDITEQTMDRTWRATLEIVALNDRPVPYDLNDLLGVEEFGCLLVAAERP